MGWVCGGPLSFYRVSLVLRSTMFVNCGVLCGMHGIPHIHTPVAATTVCKKITPEDGRGLRPKDVEL